jgi:hypothetical protein
VPFFGAAGPALDEVGLAAWIAQAEPGEALVYHRGFLAVDATVGRLEPPADRQRTLRWWPPPPCARPSRTSSTSCRPGSAPTTSPTSPSPGPKPGPPGAALSMRLIEAA